MEWSHSFPGFFFPAVAIVLFAWLLAARRLARSPAARHWTLLLLRAAALAVLLLLLADPVRVSQSQLPPRRASAVFLIDGSRSMALDRPVSRLEQVRSIVSQSQAAVAADGPRISHFVFGGDLTAVPGPAQLNGTADETRLLEAIERLPSRFGDDVPSGVFVFSDGRTTETKATSTMAELAAGYRKMGIPLHVIPVGDATDVGDVAIRDVVAPRDVRPATTVSVQVVISSRGFAGERAEVRIRPASPPEAQSPSLATLPVTLADGLQTFELALDSDRAQGELLVEVPPREHEALAENNQVGFELTSKSSKVRVLYMEGTQANEYAFIRDGLVEDPNIECTPMEVNFQYAQTATLHRIDNPQLGYPTSRQELFDYDVVICSDIARASFTQEQLDWTVELVAERGGGFAMIGGNTSFGAGFWDQTTWDGMIPVDMSGRVGQAAGTIWNVRFRAAVPLEAQSHPIWKIVDDPIRNQEIISRMPFFYGTNRTDRLKPGATILAVSDPPVSDAGVIPVFSCQTYGRGRTFAMSSDSTVDWGRDFERLWGEGDNRYFRKFWRNVVLWLAENSAGKNRRLQIETDKLIYRPGEPLKVTARAYDDELRPTSGYRLVARLEKAADPARPGEPSLPLVAGESLAPRLLDSVYEGSLTAPPLEMVPLPLSQPLATGRTMLLTVDAFDADRLVAQGTLGVKLLDESREFLDPRPDEQLLAELARRSGGRLLSSAQDVGGILASYKAVQGDIAVYKSPIWDRAWVWFSLLFLLTAEWIVRRMKGLA